MSVFRIFVLVFLAKLHSLGLAAQQPCSCSSLLDESIQKVTSIYAGFDDKVTEKTKPDYERMLSHLRSLAARASDEHDCYSIIDTYARWFKDKHIDYWFAIPSSPHAVRWVDSAQVTKYLRIRKDSIVGIWTSAGPANRYAIIEDPLKKNEFIAVVLASTDSGWKPGMVKTEFYKHDAKNLFYQGLFYRKDFSAAFDGFSMHQDRLDHYFGPSWNRENAVANKLPVTEPEPVQFKRINNHFVYLKLGRFMQYLVNELDSLIRANRAVIYSTRNLIIDLRGNHGGDGGSSQEMIQLIYTNPIVYPAWQYRSSPEGIRWEKDGVAELEKNDPYHILEAQRALLQRLIDHPGELVSGGDSIVRTLDSISHYPERVALLVDGESASSSEFFVFEGKQSKKLIIFGAPTSGAMDYGQQESIQLSCHQHVIDIPWGRNGWIERFGFRVDNIGFKPDIPIPSSEQDWIQFVVRRWSE